MKENNLYNQCIIENKKNRETKSIKRENCSQYIIYKKIQKEIKKFKCL